MKKHHSKILLDLIEKHSFSNMVEIGVGNGLTAKTILDTIVPSYPFVYYGIDPYTVYDDYNNDINGTPLRIVNNKNAAENNLSSFQKGRFVHFKLHSSVAALKFEKDTIDLLFIDGNHSYEYVKSDLERYFPLITKRGIIVIHDYYHPNFSDIKKAVDEFLEYKKSLMYDGDVVYFYKSFKVENS